MLATVVFVTSLLAVSTRVVRGATSQRYPCPPSSSDIEFEGEFVWPVSGSAVAPQVGVDVPQNDGFGPRLLRDNYDYHRGVDIPLEQGTQLYAMAPGWIRCAGTTCGYTDPAVQLDVFWDGHWYQLNYMHVSDWSQSLPVGYPLSEIPRHSDQCDYGGAVFIEQGQPIALSGTASGGTPHLHFEMRRGSTVWEATRQCGAENPWCNLPYVDTEDFTATALNATESGGLWTVWAEANFAPDELDFASVTLDVLDCSMSTCATVETHTFDPSSLNQFLMPYDSCAYDDELDEPINRWQPNYRVVPAYFNRNSERWITWFEFYDLLAYVSVPVEHLRFRVSVSDCRGNSKSDTLVVQPTTTTTTTTVTPLGDSYIAVFDSNSAEVALAVDVETGHVHVPCGGALSESLNLCEALTLDGSGGAIPGPDSFVFVHSSSASPLAWIASDGSLFACGGHNLCASVEMLAVDATPGALEGATWTVAHSSTTLAVTDGANVHACGARNLCLL